MIKGYVSSDEDDYDDYDFGYSEPVILDKPVAAPLPEIKNPSFKEKLQAALEHSQIVKLFSDAVEQGDIPALEELIARGVDVESSTPHEWTPLMKACGAGKPEAVQFLLEHGSNPNKHKELFTPLMACCTHTLVPENMKLSCARLLLQSGADVNAKDKYRTTALMYATGSGYADIVAELLEFPDVDVNIQDREGWTALFYAVNHGHVDLIEKLMEAGTDLKLKDSCERTALQLALDRDFKDIAEILGFVEEDCPDSPPEDILLSNRFLAELPDSEGQGGFYLDARNILQAFKQMNVKDISLSDLLNATDKDLYDIGVKLKPDRLNILSKGIHWFHLQPWKETSMEKLVEGVPLNLESTIALTGTIAKHLTVVNASVRYLNTRISTRQKMVDSNVEKEIVMVLVKAYVTAEKLKVLLPKILRHAQQIKSGNAPDFIYPHRKENGGKMYVRYAVGAAVIAGLFMCYCKTNFHFKTS